MARLEAAHQRLEDKGVKCGLVTRPENIYYLTGYYPSSAAVLVLRDKPIVIAHKMETSLVVKASVEHKIVDSIEKEIRKLPFKKIAIEKNSTSLKFVERNLKNKKVVDLDFLNAMRVIKDRKELKIMEKAVKVTEDAISKVQFDGTEREAAAYLEYQIRRRGEIAFEAIIAGGANSAVPHHESGDAPMTWPVIVDAGARVEHYNADITRTFVSAKRNKEVNQVYDAVCEAQRAGIKECYHGNEIKRADLAVRAVLKEYGLEKHFLHSTGHGIGLAVHEEPRLGKDAKGKFKEGMVVTVEPGVYRDFGVRIEDVVLIGRKPKVISKLPK